MSTETAIQTLPWPDRSLGNWWWMRCKLKARGKWRLVLVEILDAQESEWIRPLQDRNCYPRSFAEEWNAEFVKAEGPPEEWHKDT